MTYPEVSGWGTHDFVDATTGVLQRDVSPLFLEVLRRDPTLLGHFKTGKAATNREVEWFDREWVPYQFTTNTDITNDAVKVAFTAIETLGGKNIARWFDVGDLFMLVGSTDGTVAPGTEIYQVESSVEATNIITLTREYGGTTHSGAVSTNGLIFEKLGPVTPENSSPNGDKTHTHGPAEKNYTQIFSYDLDVSGTALAMNQYNMTDYFGTNLKELTEELKLQLERIAVYSVQGASNPAGTDANARTMNGIKYYLNRNGGNVISSGYTVPNEDLINALCRKIIQKNGQLNNRKGILACSPANAEIIADIWKDKIQINRDDTVRGTQVKTIVTKLGFSLDIVWDPNIHNNDLMILNPNKLEIVPLQGRAWFVKRYDNGTDGQTARVIGEWTTRIWDSKKDHAICTCLTTTS